MQAGLMELVLESVAQNRPGNGSDSRRRGARFGIGGTVDVIALGEKSRLFAESANVRDVSARGIGLIARRQFNPGSRFVLRLPGSDRSQAAHAVLCEALHSRPLDVGSYRIGARFLGRAA